MPTSTGPHAATAAMSFLEGRGFNALSLILAAAGSLAGAGQLFLTWRDARVRRVERPPARHRASPVTHKWARTVRVRGVKVSSAVRTRAKLGLGAIAHHAPSIVGVTLTVSMLAGLPVAVVAMASETVPSAAEQCAAKSVAPPWLAVISVGPEISSPGTRHRVEVTGRGFPRNSHLHVFTGTAYVRGVLFRTDRDWADTVSTDDGSFVVSLRTPVPPLYDEAWCVFVARERPGTSSSLMAVALPYL